MRKARLKLKAIVLSVILVASALSSLAESDTIPDKAHFRLRYVINIPEIDSTFVDNASRITDMRDFLQQVSDDKSIRITDVWFRGTASPDGTYDFNVWLSENRLRTFKELLRSYVDIPDHIIRSNTSDIPWNEFRNKVEESDIEYRDEILAIIDEEPCLVPFYNNRRIDARLLKLKSLHKGKAWEILKSPILRDLRYGDAVFSFQRVRPVFPVLPEEAPVVHQPDFCPEPLPWIDKETWMPRFYIKSNFLRWILFSADVAFELDFAPHWSFTLPVSYCAMDWFKSTIKFRNFTVQPEVRYWFKHRDNDGFFVGAHFQMCYYNYAFDGEYRYQDFRGRTPALGGGIGAGYRKPISRNKRWRLEFELGAGIYPLDYSLFQNTPNVRDGQWVERRKKTYYGLDNAAITIAYSFDIKRWQRTYCKEGGNR